MSFPLHIAKIRKIFESAMGISTFFAYYFYQHVYRPVFMGKTV